ncbi:unnamed protein product [Moneuplotes crassus]|uniref:Uncharacterized protein n=1 Tax=Euplotes crassus TaxID=5936 RepID=A0AAD1XI47_EUPCR|nr:unnamed protein product [Moneuplotes crassus]
MNKFLDYNQKVSEAKRSVSKGLKQGDTKSTMDLSKKSSWSLALGDLVRQTKRNVDGFNQTNPKIGGIERSHSSFNNKRNSTRNVGYSNLNLNLGSLESNNSVRGNIAASFEKDNSTQKAVKKYKMLQQDFIQKRERPPKMPQVQEQEDPRVQLINKEISTIKKEQVLLHKDFKRLRDGQENILNNQVTELRLQEQLSVLHVELEKKFESKLKHALQTQPDKKVDKVAASILKAVDQKFHKDAELKQKIFYKLDERLNQVEGNLNKKSNELTNLVNSKVMCCKTELNEAIQELRRTCKIMIDQIDTTNIKKLIETDRQNFENRIENLEQSNSSIKAQINTFKSDIIEDVEQLRAEVNSVKISQKKQLNSQLTSDEVETMIQNNVPDFLIDYAKIDAVNNLKERFSAFQERTEENIQESLLKADEIHNQVYDKFIMNIKNEWDLRFENFDNRIESLGDDLSAQIEGQDQIFKDTMDVQSEALSHTSDEIRELKSQICNLNTKIIEIQNQSNLVDTKDDTGSKSSSRMKREEAQGYDLPHNIDDSLQKFKISPAKSDDSEPCQDHKKNINHMDIEEPKNNIEDNSVFGLTPTSQLQSKGMSRINKSPFDEKIEQSSKKSSVIVKPVEQEHSSPSVQEDNEDQKDFENHENSEDHEDQEDLESQEEDQKTEVEIEQEIDDKNSLPSLQSLQENEPHEVSQRSLIIDQSSEEEVSEHEHIHDESPEEEVQNKDSDEEEKEEIKIQEYDDQEIEDAPEDSGDVSQLLVNQSILEMKNNSSIQDPSIHHVVDEISEYILAEETFDAINDVLRIGCSEQDNTFEEENLIYEEPPQHRRMGSEPDFNPEGSHREYDINYNEYGYQDASEIEGEGELDYGEMFDSDQENHQLNTYDRIDQRGSEQLKFNHPEFHKTSLNYPPRYK